jgi:hypothetical protein
MGTLLFPILFLIMSVLCLWVIIGCKGWWAAKFWLINFTLIFGLLFWTSLSSYLGWAVDNGLPDKFRLVGFHSQEPEAIFILTDKHEDKKTTSIMDTFAYTPKETIRLYKIPYNKKMHEKLEQASERIMKGGYVIGTKDTILGAEEIRGMEDKSGDPNNAGANKASGSLSKSDLFNFYILPPSLFIRKPQ